MSDSLMMYPDKSMWSIIQDYALLPGQFANQGMSEDYIKELLIGSTANQEYFVCSEKDATVTVMGHTHDHYLRKFQKYDKGQEQIVYANSGAWTDSSKKTFVDIIMARNKYGELPIRVELHKWNKGAPKLVASQNTPNFELSVGKTAAGSPSTPRRLAPGTIRRRLIPLTHSAGRRRGYKGRPATRACLHTHVYIHALRSHI